MSEKQNVMKNRLVELLEKFRTPICEGMNAKLSHVEDLAYYLLAEGVIVPPCSEGQDIYIVRKTKVERTFARTFKYLGEEIGLEIEATCWKRKRNGMLTLKTDIIHEDEFSKTVFLTLGEAQKVLVEKRKERARDKG